MRHGRSLTLSVLLGGILLAIPLIAQAGGTIKGKVTYSGKAIPAKEFAFSKFPNPAFCKKNPSQKGDDTRLLKEVEVDGSKGLKNAIVSVRDIKTKGLKKSYKPKVMAKLCEFLPFTGVLVNKGKFYVENTDSDPDDPKSAEGVLHNPHSFDVLGAKSSTLFNIGLAKKGDNLDKKIKMRMARKGSVLRLQCDQHEFMQAWFLPVKNMHFATSGADGSFEIKDVPAGKHKVLAWHPVAGNVEMNVEVKDGATVEVTFDIKKKKKFKG
ncbi:MAG: carboxypeptidase-like regulatory domain-containing protein [Nitrospirota bacterium]|nr:carboxypeptidase-like regulatory domain-containing protein [Nitrospirota bacterium]